MNFDVNRVSGYRGLGFEDIVSFVVYVIRSVLVVRVMRILCYVYRMT